MRRITLIILACACLVGMSGVSWAVDVKVKGQWEFSFGWADNFRGYGQTQGVAGFKDKDKGNRIDTFNARHRARTQFDIIASEQLSAQILLEIGDINWGRTNGSNSGPSSGGALDADGVNVETKRAYLDWMVPNTDVTVRMGIQGIYLPTATGYYTPVYGTDATGITVSSPITDWLGITAFWVRAFDRYDEDPNDSNSLDEMDIFGLILPLTFEGMSITPWGLYTRIGGESGWWGYHSKGYGSTSEGGFDGSATAWHVGFAYELTMFDPLTFHLDAMYGRLSGNGGKYNANAWNADGSRNQDRSSNPGTEGWWMDAALRYKLDWATAGIFGWYGSGDKANAVHDGKYGRIPVLADDQGFMATNFGFDGSPNLIGSDRAISNSGVGTWGIGVEMKDISFIEDLTHTIRFAYYRGTNDSEVIENISRANINPDTGRRGNLLVLGEYQYMTDKDWAFEVNFEHKYQIYENLAVFLDLGYINLHLDSDTWDNANSRGDSDTDDAWKAQVHFQFKF